MDNNPESLATAVMDAAFHIHKNLGPGLLESVYEVVLAKTLEMQGLNVERQKPIPGNFRALAPSREESVF